MRETSLPRMVVSSAAICGVCPSSWWVTAETRTRCWAAPCSWPNQTATPSKTSPTRQTKRREFFMRTMTANAGAHTCRARGRRPRSGTEGAIRHCVQRFCSAWSSWSNTPSFRLLHRRNNHLDSVIFRARLASDIGLWPRSNMLWHQILDKIIPTVQDSNNNEPRRLV